MLKRVLHAANQVVAHPETHSSTRSLKIQNTVNDKVDLLKISGDSWQFQREKSRNLFDTNRLTKEYFISEISDGRFKANGWAYPIEHYLPRDILKPDTTYYSRCTYTIDKSGNDGTLEAYSYNIAISMYNVTIQKTTWVNFINTSDFIEGETRTVTYSFTTPDAAVFDNYKFLIYTQRFIGQGESIVTRSDVIFSDFIISEEPLEYEPFQPSMPSTDCPSEIKSVSGELMSCGRNFLTNEAKPYDRYRGSEITIPELRAIRDKDGNIMARDYLHVDRSQKRAWVERNITIIALTGDERVSIEASTDDYVGFCTQLANKKFGYYNVICNYVKTCAKENSGSNYYASGVNTIVGRPNNKSVSFYLPISFIGDTVESIKAKHKELYDSGNPITIQYELANPVIEELPYSDYLLSTAQYQTDIRFVDIDEHL